MKAVQLYRSEDTTVFILKSIHMTLRMTQCLIKSSSQIELPCSSAIYIFQYEENMMQFGKILPTIAYCIVFVCGFNPCSKGLQQQKQDNTFQILAEKVSETSPTGISDSDHGTYSLPSPTALTIRTSSSNSNSSAKRGRTIKGMKRTDLPQAIRF